MQVHGNMDFRGIGKLLRPGLVATDFPTSPTVGELVLKDKKLFMCVDVVEGLPFWANLVNELSMYRHDQNTPALEWTITHGLNTNIVMVQIYDANGLQVIPDSINCSVANQTTVTFGAPTAGVAAITAGDTLGLPRANSAYSEDFTNSAVWVVNHNLGFNPSVTAIVGGYVVQPVSVIHNSVLQCSVTFSTAQSGSVRCL